MNRRLVPFDKYARAALIDRQRIRARWSVAMREADQLRRVAAFVRARRVARIKMVAQEFVHVAVIPLGVFLAQLFVGAAALIVFVLALVGFFR